MVNNELIGLGKLAFGDPGTFAPFSAEAWKYALEMTLLGMGMIFSVLIILWGVLTVFKLVFVKPAKKAEEKATVVKIEEVPTPVSAPATAVNNDAELVAILTAAIVAYESEKNPDVTPANFRVVSFRRTNGGRSWNAK